MKKTKFWVLTIVTIFVLCCLLSWVEHKLGWGKVAKAGRKEGLWQELATTADQVNVRVIRDTKNGNVCYVASSFVQKVGNSPTDPYREVVGISVSCVPEHQVSPW